MTISVKLTDTDYTKISQPYYKLADTQWAPLKKVYVKQSSGWEEVWPGDSIVYIHTGYGYAMNMAACFGNPTEPGDFVFINNGKIGGITGDTLTPALRTGNFPAGSTVTLINNGYIFGAGGKGGYYTYVASTTSSGVQHGGSCFTADTLVTMADGVKLRIDQVAVGDLVRTSRGVSRVMYIHMPLLQDRPLLAMDGGLCKTSAEHTFWSLDPDTGIEWWATRDIDQWSMEMMEGNTPIQGPVPFDLSALVEKRWIFATEKGWKETGWYRVPAGPETQLYHLHLEEHHGYFADGFLVEDGVGKMYLDTVVNTDYVYGGEDWDNFTLEGKSWA